MKVLNVQIPEELHTQMRLQAITEGKSVKQFVTEAILTAIETKKEQTR